MRIIGIKSIIFKAFPFLNRKSQSLEIRCETQVEARLFYKYMAIETAINLIANTLSLVDFRTFEKGKETMKDNYYLFNVEPNQNSNASAFWRDLYHNLVYENEALVVMQDKQLYVANDFKRRSFAFYPNYYEDVRIGDYKLKEKLNEDQVFYFKLHSQKMVDLIDGMYRDYGDLVEYSKNTYKRSNAKRGILKIPTNYPQTEGAQKSLRDLLEVRFKDFYHAENGAVLPLTGGLEYEDLSSQTYKNGSDSRDIRNLVDDVFDYVAIAFQVPPQMLKGSVADSERTWASYMTHCIRPLAELIEDEINRKFYGKKNYLEKTYLRADTSLVKYSDLKDIADSIDKLTRNGVNTIDDNRRLLGREELGEGDGNLRFVTKNLDTLERMIEGGE